MKLFEKAKRADLVEAARANGFELRKQGSGWSAKHCPHCSEGSSVMPLSLFARDGLWRWNCFKCNRGGSVVDFCAAIWGCTEMEAAKRLANDGEFGVVKTAPATDLPAKVEIAQKAAQALAVNDALEHLLRGGYTREPEAVEYLKNREISEEVQMEACSRGILRYIPVNPREAQKLLLDRVGFDRMAQAGIIKPGKTYPAIAFRPLVFFFPGQKAAEFRLARKPKEGEAKTIRYGSSKWPWFWAHSKHNNNIKTVYIVEGVIDMLSMVELGLKDGDAILAMPGTSSWQERWFSALHERHPGVRFILALDSDAPGKKAAEEIMKVLEKLKAPIMQVEPQGGKDWNEHLIALRQANRKAKAA